MRKLTRSQKAAISRYSNNSGETIDVDIERHSRICSVCRHPLSTMIDEAFLQWISPSMIVEEFKLSSRNALYNHAHVLKLFERRDRSLRFALGNIIEQADSVQVTAQDIIRAVYAYAHINDEGMWIQPVPQLFANATRNVTLPSTPNGVENDANR